MLFQLLDGAGAEGVAGSSNDGVALGQKTVCQLRSRRCFAGSVHADEHDHHRRISSFQGLRHRRIKVPIPCFQERSKGTLEAGFEDFRQVRPTAQAGPDQLVAQSVDDGEIEVYLKPAR